MTRAVPPSTFIVVAALSVALPSAASEPRHQAATNRLWRGDRAPVAIGEEHLYRSH